MDKITLATFSASDVARITGRSLDSQRQDRRLFDGWPRLMPRIKNNKAVFDAKSLAGLFALQALMELGVKAGRAAAYADRCARHIAHWAFVAQGIEVPGWHNKPYLDPRPHRYLVADGRDQTTTDRVEDASKGLGRDAAALLVVDLQALGCSLAEKVDQPLAIIKS